MLLTLRLLSDFLVSYFMTTSLFLYLLAESTSFFLLQKEKKMLRSSGEIMRRSNVPISSRSRPIVSVCPNIVMQAIKLRALQMRKER